MNTIAEGRRLACFGLLLFLLNAPTLAAQVADGQATFEERCIACHTTGSDRLVGPGLEGITERRDRDWIISFITNPDGMIAAGDSIATDLLLERVGRFLSVSLADQLLEDRDLLKELLLDIKSGSLKV